MHHKYTIGLLQLAFSADTDDNLKKAAFLGLPKRPGRERGSFVCPSFTVRSIAPKEDF